MSEQAHLLVKELGELKGSVVKIGQVMALYGEHFLPVEVTEALHTLEDQTIALTGKDFGADKGKLVLAGVGALPANDIVRWSNDRIAFKYPASKFSAGKKYVLSLERADGVTTVGHYTVIAVPETTIKATLQGENEASVILTIREAEEPRIE